MADLFQPGITRYSKGSYIIVEGKPDTNRFFIIQEGKVQILREVDTGGVVGHGEIFGVISAMAGYSYIETAIALTDVTLLTIEKKQYGDLIRDNTPIAVNIIQQFSQRLRGLDDALSRQTLNSVGAPEPSHLYQVAEYYVKRQRYNHAFYAYQQYTKYCPEGEHRDFIRKKMMKIAPKVMIVKPVYPSEKMERTYPGDCLLFAEGEEGDELYIIQQGSVKVTKIVQDQEVVLAVLKKGDIFGEMALLEAKPRTANVETYEDCTVLAVNRANFQELIAVSPELVAKLTTLLAERIWQIYKRLANTLIDNPLGRIFDALVIQLEKDRVALDTNEPHTCGFGFKELAGMAGFPPEESGLLFKKLLLTKRVSLVNDKLYITNVTDVFRQTEFYRRAHKLAMSRKENSDSPSSGKN